MKNISKRALSLLLATTMMVAVLTSCGGKPALGSSSNPVQPQVKKDTVIIATQNEPPSVHPVDHNSVAGNYMNILTHNGLFKIDADLNPVPDLVKEYKNVSETQWEFTLKENIKFHDGTALTSQDVKASLEWAKTYTVAAQYTKDVVDVEVIDDLNFKLTTNGPAANLLNNLASHANFIVPKALIDSGNDFSKNPIGTGPYKFVNWVLGDKIEFVKFDEYFDKENQPTITNMVWKVIPEGASRTIALEAGEVDFVIEVEAMDVNRLKDSNSVGVAEVPGTAHTFMMINTTEAPLDNPLVRKAINAAIDKQSVLEVAMNGLAIPAISQTPVGIPGESTRNADEYSVEKARQYLAESGVDPATIKFPIICSNDEKRRAGEVIQANLNEIGIKAELVSMDLATYLSVTQDGNYVSAIGGYNTSSMLTYMQGVYHSASIGAANKARFNNPEIDALIDKASVTVDAEERNKILEECAAKLNEIVVLVPMYQPTVIRAYSNLLDGVAVNAAGTVLFQNVSWKQ